MKKEKKKDSLNQAVWLTVVQIALANGVFPVLAVLCSAYFLERKYLILFLSILLLLLLDMILIFFPIMRSCNILFAPVDSKEMFDRINGLKRGTGLERVFYQIYNRQRENVENEYSSEILRQEAELMALQSQMNPHFLYNTLECIRGYALMHEVTEIANMTEALAKLSRKMTASNSKLVTLQEEIKLVENYMTIQRFRFNNRFQFVVKVKETEVLEAQVLNLMLQPIVENAVVHGFHGRRGEYLVSVDAYITGRRLIIKVQDDGVGISQNRMTQINQKINETSIMDQMRESKSHLGIALPNVNKRIKLNFGEEYGLNIMSTEGIGTTVEIVLPLDS